MRFWVNSKQYDDFMIGKTAVIEVYSESFSAEQDKPMMLVPEPTKFNPSNPEHANVFAKLLPGVEEILKARQNGT